ncbi:MAG: DUF362 domain-containing protein [Gemmataceae bacterium]|nr:DUF362 domain-containing protein [Gemmataceae bacterium]
MASTLNPTGGWSYAPGHSSQLEPSCLGLLALSLEPERYADAIAKTLTFIAAGGNADGSYRQHDGRAEAIWPTSLVLFVKSTLSITDVARTANYLLATRAKVPDEPETSELHDMNVNLIGWPWAEANFSWVEPTSWACLALRNLGLGEHPRVVEGIKLLLDRAFDTGGVNYGNRRILGKMTDPIPGPTALMLIALQGENHPRLPAAVRYLIEQIRTDDLDHLCWAKLALDLYRDLPDVEATLAKLDDQILAAVEKRQQLGWLRQSCYRQALTVLALGVEKRNFFRLQPSVQSAAFKMDASTISPSGPSIIQRVGSWFRRFLLRATSNVKPLPANSAVHIARAGSYDDDLTAILQKQYESFRATVPLKGKRVVLKPNLVEWHRDKVINTHPKFVGAVIEMCKREGAAEVIVAEGPGHWRNVEYLVTESGLGDVLKEHDVRFVDINHDEPVKLPNMGQLTNLDYLYMSSTLANADVVISLPKLKTHHWAGATLSLKNLFGTLPGIYYGWPKNELHWRGIHNSIVDIALTRTPELAIVDGIIGMEGDGPLNGTAKPFGAIIMGHDLVAADATCCRLMMLDPDKIGYLVLGAMKKLGRMKEAEIAQLGETIASLAQPFATVPHLDDLRMRKSA